VNSEGGGFDLHICRPPYPQQAPPTPFGDVGVNGLMGVGETWKQVEFSQEPGG
jgi:hypothetical protein